MTITDQASGRDAWIGKFELEASLARRGVTVQLHARSAARLVQASDAEWLSWARPGTAFEIKVEGRYEQALLTAVSAGDTAYVTSSGGTVFATFRKG